MTTKKFYFISLGAVLLASFYPIYMGIIVLWAHFNYGGVQAQDYPKYIIPYTPLCIAVIAVVALFPLIFKFLKKLTLLTASILGIAFFIISELCFEKIMVFEDAVFFGGKYIESWQLYSCMMTPSTYEAIGNPLASKYSPAFKVHFYIIAILIVLAVIGIVYGFTKMIRETNFDKKTPLITQLITVSVFIGLCILACFTAFFRTGTLQISALSAWLMSIFFIVFGITSGVYVGSILYGKQKLLSQILPVIISAITVIVMYIGEYVMMKALFKYGSGFIFEPLGNMPFAIIDIFIVLLAGFITYIIMSLINKSREVPMIHRGMDDFKAP